MQTHLGEEARPSTIVTPLVLAVIAPMSAAGWALANWWPVSGAVWLAATVVVWLVLFAHADEGN